jgi:hypothetical protein
MKEITIFLSTRNRLKLIKKTLDNIQQICPHHKVLVGNASSNTYFKEVSGIINSYSNTIEINYNPDPGLSVVYSELYKKIDTELALVWADDMKFLKNFDHLLNHFEEPNIHLVALPMIDDISAAPLTTSTGWPKDEYGCALWNTSTGRCSHHSITRVNYFKKFGDVCGTGDPNDVIDNFCHRHTTSSQRIWPQGPYVLHTRLDDSTRLNTVLGSGRFRFPSHASFKTPAERD